MKNHKRVDRRRSVSAASVVAGLGVVALAAGSIGTAQAAKQTSVFDGFVDFHLIQSDATFPLEAGGEVDADSEAGAGLRVHTKFWEHGRMLLEFDWRDYEPDAATRTQVTNLSLGMGGAYAFGPATLFAAVTYEDARVRIEQPPEPVDLGDAPDGDSLDPNVTARENDGIGLQLGVGVTVSDYGEVYLRAKQIEFSGDDVEPETAVLGGLRVFLGKSVSLFFEGEQFSETEITDLRAGVGFSFGQ